MKWKIRQWLIRVLRSSLKTLGAQYFIFVSGGCVTSVYHEDLQETDDFNLIDFDSAEGGECPVCRMDIEVGDASNDDQCPRCGYSVWNGYSTWDKDEVKAILCWQSRYLDKGE